MSNSLYQIMFCVVKKIKPITILFERRMARGLCQGIREIKL